MDTEITIVTVDCQGDDTLVLCSSCAAKVREDGNTSRLPNVGFTFAAVGEPAVGWALEDELCEGCGEPLEAP